MALDGRDGLIYSALRHFHPQTAIKISWSSTKFSRLAVWPCDSGATGVSDA